MAIERRADRFGARADTGVEIGNGVMVLVQVERLEESRVHVGDGPRSEYKGGNVGGGVFRGVAEEMIVLDFVP